MSDVCMMCVETNLKCPECKCGCDLDRDTDLEDGDVVECLGCGEEWRFWVGRLIDEDEYNENYCDSAAAERYEEAAYGDDRPQYTSSRSYSGGGGYNGRDYYTDQ